MSPMRKSDPVSDIEFSLVELEEAISLIQHLLPAEAPQTPDQQALAGIGYIVITMRMHIAEANAAIERLYGANRVAQDDSAALH